MTLRLPFGLDRLAECTAPALADDRSGEDFVSYRDLVRRVEEAAAIIANSGRPVTFQYGFNTITGVIAYLACLAGNAPVALLPGDLSAEKMALLHQRYRPGLVLNFGGADEGDLPTIVTGSDTPAHPDLALLLSTSGSTGSPRMVRLSRYAVEANAAVIVAALGINSTDRAALTLPMSYAYGLSVLNSHLRAGASIVLTELGLTDRRLWDRLAAYRVTSISGVPYVYQTLARLDFERLLPPSLTMLTQAGGALPHSLIERFHRFMSARAGRFVVMYGQTEATARIAILDSADLPAHLGSVGRAVPGGSLSVEDGEIVYRGPNVMMGYADSAEDLVAGDVQGGVLRTGDLGYLDQEGYLWITGRLKRIAKVNGLRINLDEVEALAARFAPSAVLETPRGLTIFLEGSGRTNELRREIAATLGIPPSSLVLRHVDALPRGANGKIDRLSLGQLA